jgi:hypothetical protein
LHDLASESCADSAHWHRMHSFRLLFALHVVWIKSAWSDREKSTDHSPSTHANTDIG